MSSFPVSRDHAADAAKLLRRLAIFVALAVMPGVALFSRTAATIALPLAAALLAFATLVDPDRAEALPRLREGLRSWLVRAVLYLCVWLALSLVWTPFPGSAAGRLGAGLAVVATGAVAIFVLPEKMRASTLNLIPIGAFGCAVALAGLAGLALLDVGPAWLRPERPVIERGMAAICLFAFVSAGWLISRGRRIDAVALLAVVAMAFGAQMSAASGAAFAAGLLVFVLARLAPGAAAVTVTAAAAATLLALPLLPAVARLVPPEWLGWNVREVEVVASFNALLAAEWPRLFTGHGFDTFRLAIRAGLVSVDLPRIPHLELWFEAGLPGVLAALTGVWVAARWALRARAGVGAAVLAVLAAAICYAAIGSPAAPRGYGMSQNWWLSTLALAALAIASIARGQFRTSRPRVRQAAPLPAE